MHIRFLNEDLARLETESLNLLFGYGLAAEELLNLSAARQGLSGAGTASQTTGTNLSRSLGIPRARRLERKWECGERGHQARMVDESKSSARLSAPTLAPWANEPRADRLQAGPAL